MQQKRSHKAHESEVNGPSEAKLKKKNQRRTRVKGVKTMHLLILLGVQRFGNRSGQNVAGNPIRKLILTAAYCQPVTR